MTPWVTALWEALEAEGIRTWFDANAIPAGCDWHEEIGKGIVGSRVFIPVLTAKYLEADRETLTLTQPNDTAPHWRVNTESKCI